MMIIYLLQITPKLRFLHKTVEQDAEVTKSLLGSSDAVKALEKIWAHSESPRLWHSMVNVFRSYG